MYTSHHDPAHSFKETHDGTLTVKWLPSVSGDYKLNATVNGIHLDGSPFHAAVARGEIDAAGSKILDFPARVGAGSRGRGLGRSLNERSSKGRLRVTGR